MSSGTGSRRPARRGSRAVALPEPLVLVALAQDGLVAELEFAVVVEGLLVVDLNGGVPVAAIVEVGIGEVGGVERRGRQVLPQGIVGDALALRPAGEGLQGVPLAVFVLVAHVEVGGGVVAGGEAVAGEPAEGIGAPGLEVDDVLGAGILALVGPDAHVPRRLGVGSNRGRRVRSSSGSRCRRGCWRSTHSGSRTPRRGCRRRPVAVRCPRCGSCCAGSSRR